MIQSFEKWQGCNNDFIVFRAHFSRDHYLLDSFKRKAPFLCSRKGDGIGADGIIIVDKEVTDAEYRLRVINSDGSIAKNCGNGLRCAAASIRIAHEEQRKESEDPLDACILTIEGKPFTCQYRRSKRTITPLITMEDIELNEETQLFSCASKAVATYPYQKKIRKWAFATLGNNHILIFVDQIDKESFYSWAAKIQESPDWDGINVHMLAQDSVSEKTYDLAVEEAFKILSWERGAGPTPACGSGASSAACSIYSDGLIERDKWLEFISPGGSLFCQQDENNGPVKLTGPVEKVFTGFCDI
jgi:diaminopimelate epimerase